MKKLDRFIAQTGGRFTTIKVGKGYRRGVYCAHNLSPSNKYLTFDDVNSGLEIKVEKRSVKSAKCGDLKY